MRPALLAELADLFSREALKEDKRGNHDEADRLWDVSNEIHERFKKAEHIEASRPIR